MTQNKQANKTNREIEVKVMMSIVDEYKIWVWERLPELKKKKGFDGVIIAITNLMTREAPLKVIYDLIPLNQEDTRNLLWYVRVENAKVLEEKYDIR